MSSNSQRVPLLLFISVATLAPMQASAASWCEWRLNPFARLALFRSPGEKEFQKFVSNRIGLAPADVYIAEARALVADPKRASALSNPEQTRADTEFLDRYETLIESSLRDALEVYRQLLPSPRYSFFPMGLAPRLPLQPLPSGSRGELFFKRLKEIEKKLSAAIVKRETDTSRADSSFEREGLPELHISICGARGAWDRRPVYDEDSYVARLLELLNAELFLRGLAPKVRVASRVKCMGLCGLCRASEGHINLSPGAAFRGDPAIWSPIGASPGVHIQPLGGYNDPANAARKIADQLIKESRLWSKTSQR